VLRFSKSCSLKRTFLKGDKKGEKKGKGKILQEKKVEMR
jgi:hypothetical protein